MTIARGGWSLWAAGALVAGVLALGISLGVAMGGPGESGFEEPGAGAGPPVTPGAGFGDAPTAGAPTVGDAPDGPGGSDALRLAVARAPFEEDRRAPSARYRMPGDEVPRAPREEEEEEEEDLPEFRLLGSAAVGMEGWAVVQLGDDDPTLLRSGQSLGGFRLAAVQPDMVVMASDSRMMQVPLAQPSPSGPPRAGRGRDDDDDDRGNQNNGRAAGRGAAGRGQAGNAGAAGGLGQLLQGLSGADQRQILQQLTGQGGTIQFQLPAGGATAGQPIFGGGEIIIQRGGGPGGRGGQITIQRGGG